MPDIVIMMVSNHTASLLMNHDHAIVIVVMEILQITLNIRFEEYELKVRPCLPFKNNHVYFTLNGLA